MREIKFKGVDEFGAIHDLTAINWETMSGLCEVDGFVGLNWCKFEKFIQFTGLKDKNGIEIYEDYVLRSYHEFGAIEEHFGNFGFWVTRDNFVTLMDIMERGDGHKMEVMGNIYENPELIETENN